MDDVVVGGCMKEFNGGRCCGCMEVEVGGYMEEFMEFGERFGKGW